MPAFADNLFVSSQASIFGGDESKHRADAK